MSKKARRALKRWSHTVTQLRPEERFPAEEGLVDWTGNVIMFKGTG
jgi:hypothetical protein